MLNISMTFVPEDSKPNSGSGKPSLKSPMNQSKTADKGKQKGIDLILFDLFRSLKFTIFLLILLAIISIIGTLITQNASSSDYVERYGVGLYEVLNFFGLFDMYHSWWFKTILSLMVLNLIACSLQRLPGVWHQIFRDSGSKGLEDSMLKTLPYVKKIQNPNLTEKKGEEIIRTDLKRWFKNSKRIETETAITLFSEKGRFSRLGVYVTHLSILIILVGGLIGSQFGFKGFANIFKGETVDQMFVRADNKEIPKPLNFSVRCDDFRITYYDLKGPQKHVKEYMSLLTILENGKEVLKKTIRVNHPLHYKGLAFYQSNYGTASNVTLGVNWKAGKEKTVLKASEGETVPIPNTNTHIQILQYNPQVHTFGEGVQVVLFKPNQAPRAYWLLKGFPKMDQQRGDEFFLTFDGVTSREYTGLQVTKDPGVWVVWGGCALLILGLVVSFFFSHQRVWIRIPRGSRGEIVLAGSVDKNRIGFERTFNELAEEVKVLGQ